MSNLIKDLELKIENILRDGGELYQISKEIKKSLSTYKTELKSSFLNGTRGKQFVVKHTKFYDNLISLIYKTVLRYMFGKYLPMQNSIPIVVVALGSYGREEMTVHSDIDLMIAYVDVEGYNTEKIIKNMIYMAWDAGLNLGHRVHLISEIVEIAETDITIKTALIESRKVIGSSLVWELLETQLNAIRNSNKIEFLTNKFEDRGIGNHTIYELSMEPNLKEGIGGVRDANTLFWILNIVYGVNSIRDLSGSLFSESEYKNFISAFDYLLSVRTALHLSSKKKRDKINLDDIPTLSEMLSINSHTQFFQKLLQSMWFIHSFFMKVSRKALKNFEFQHHSIRRIREGRILKNIFLISDKLYISSNIKFQNLDDFIKTALLIPDVKFRTNDTVFILDDAIDDKSIEGIDRESFIKLFQRQNTYPIVKLLFTSSTLDKLLPPFKKIMFYPQFDGYHKHSVELHSLKTLKEVERIEVEQLQNIYNQLSDKEQLILKIASLFHDIGKGRVDNHHKVGVKVIRSFLKELEIDEEIIERVTLLIRYHTLMTNVAYHEDIYNESVIFSFTSKLKEESNLKLLYLLTYADVRSVSKTTLNSYSNNLLYELYKRATHSFVNKELLKESERREKMERKIANSERYKALPRTLQKNIMKIGSNLAFFKLSSSEIIDIVEWLSEVEKFDFKLNNGEFLSIKVVRKSSANFDIAYLLNRVTFLSVVSLDIFELFNGAKYFQIDFSETIDEEDIPHIQETIQQSFSNKKKRFLKVEPKIERDEVKIDYNYSNSYAKLTVHTLNQNGLLAYLLKLFEDANIDIVSSKVQTFKRRVKDTFLFKKGENSSEESCMMLIDKIANS